MPWVCLQCVIVVFPVHAHLLFIIVNNGMCVDDVVQGTCILPVDAQTSLCISAGSLGHSLIAHPKFGRIRYQTTSPTR